MAKRLLIFEDGEVRLGDFVVPGNLRSQSVRCAVRFDKAKQDSLSGTNKTAMGWEDADISLEFDLVTDEVVSPEAPAPQVVDCYEKLSKINAVFKGYDDHANPQVFTTTNRHLRARGIDRVVFAGLESRETNDDDVIVCTMHFVEHNPPVVTIEKRAQGTGAAPAVSVKPHAAELSNDILIDVD